MVGKLVAGALALAAAPSVAQTASTDLTYANPIAGSWRYSPTESGSEATFTSAAGFPQVTIRCTRATRRVSILKPAPAASPTLWVWTSTQSRSVPATFDPATARASADLGMMDGLLDALALSRGRVGFATSGAAPLVLPAWGEIARVVEDCRA